MGGMGPLAATEKDARAELADHGERAGDTAGRPRLRPRIFGMRDSISSVRGRVDSSEVI